MIKLILEKRKDNEQYIRLRYDLKGSKISEEQFLNGVNSYLSQNSAIIGDFNGNIQDMRRYYERFSKISKVYKHKSEIFITTGIFVHGKNQFGGLEFLSDNGVDVAKKSDDIIPLICLNSPSLQETHFKAGHWISS